MSRLSEPRATFVVLDDKVTLFVPSRCHLHEGDFEPELDSPARSIRRALDIAGERPEPVEAGDRPVQMIVPTKAENYAKAKTVSRKIHWDGFDCNRRRGATDWESLNGSEFHDLVIEGDLNVCRYCRRAFLES